MIRKSSHQLCYQTSTKSQVLRQIFEDYIHDLNFYIDKMIKGEIELKKFPNTNELGIIKHSQWVQVLLKNSSEIIRSQIKRANERRYKKYQKIYAKCLEQGRRIQFLSKKYSELQLNPIQTTKYFTRPNVKNIKIILDSRLVNFKNGKFFDEFIQIKTPYFRNKRRAYTLNLPINQHKQSLKFQNWERKKSIRIRMSKNGQFYLDFFYEKETPSLRQEGIELGIDQGYKKLITCSNGQMYGQELEDHYKKIANKIRGSKAHKRAIVTKNNEIRRACNKFFNENKDLKILYIEDLKNVKHKSKVKVHRKVMNKMQYWSYRTCMDKLDSFSQENGIQLIKVNPSYTSQTCSRCGVVDKESRQGQRFHCLRCGYEIDADLNASINIYNRGVCIPSNSKSI